MKTAELKNILIHRISEIDDVSFLEAIRTILDSKTEKEVISLTEAQLDDIRASKKEIAEGLFVEQEDLDKDVAKWLSGK
jgi:predicted transcriptional regulator